MKIFYQGGDKGGYEGVGRENIAEEGSPPWVNVQEKLFLRNRQVYLDEKLLKKLGMTQLIIREKGLLFFYWLMFPMCDTSLSRIPEDQRNPYYS